MPTVPLSISALSFDILIALAQAPGGLGAGALGRTVDGAPTSVQNNLRSLSANGLIHRVTTRYLLSGDASGVPQLVAAGLRLAAPEAAMRLVLRANDAVEFASQDDGGFVVGMRGAADPAALDALDESIATIRDGRPNQSVPVVRFNIEELSRILGSAMGLRARIATATILKGSIRGPGRMASAGYPYRPGRDHHNS